MISLLFVLLAPHDTILVDVLLATTQTHVVVEAEVDADSTLHLPAREVYELCGLGTPPGPWITPQAFERMYPTIVVRWIPSALQVVVLDPLAVLPASRRAQERGLAQSRFAVPFAAYSGGYASLSWDGEGEGAMLDAGYTYRNHVGVAGRVDYTGAAAWSGTLALRHLALSYEDGLARPPTVGGRVALGPVWLSATYTTPQRPVQYAGLLRLGPVQAFGSQQYGVLTLQPTAQMVVQASQVWSTRRTTFRLSIGQAPASPFSIPAVSLTH